MCFTQNRQRMACDTAPSTHSAHRRTLTSNSKRTPAGRLAPNKQRGLPHWHQRLTTNKPCDFKAHASQRELHEEEGRATHRERARTVHGDHCTAALTDVSNVTSKYLRALGPGADLEPSKARSAWR